MAFLDFLKKPAKKTFGFLGDVAEAALPGSQQVQAVNQINRDVKSKLEAAAKKKGASKDSELVKSFSFLQDKATPVKTASKFGVDVARGLAKVPETASRSFIEGVNDVIDVIPGASKRNEATQNSADITDPLRKLAYGPGKVETYQTRQQGNEAKLKNSRFGALATPLSLLGLGATVATDLTGFGSGEKQVGKELIEQLAKEGSEQGVKKLLEKAGANLGDDAVRAIASTKDKNIVENIIKRVSPTLSPGKAIDAVTPGTLVDPLGKGSEQIANKAPSIVEASIPKINPPVTGEVLPSDPFDEILGAVKGAPASKGQAPIKGAVSAMKEQEKLLSQERGARFAAGTNAGKDVPGSEGYFKEVEALKGKYKTADYTPMIDDIGPDRAEQLFSSARQKIINTPDSIYEELGLHPGGAKLNTQRAVRKVLGLEPGIPTRSELKLLGVYSPKLAEGLKESLPIHRKIFDAAAAIFGNARSAKSTLDLSMGGRQGLFVAARHPKEWAQANLESIKYAKDKKYFDSEMKAIHGDEWGKLIDEYNPSVLTGGAGHEEQYAVTDIIGKVPGVKASERAYTGGLTKLRKDVLTKNLQAYGATAEEAEKNLGKKGLEGLIEAVSTLTGRGGKKGGWVEKHATTLQEALFSPRLWASRLQPLNPVFWKRIGPAGRKEALESLGSFAAVASVVLGAAVAAGAEVETDPRSSDFLKIKVGDTRYDILGGFQQNLVFGARQLAGSTKSSTTGAVTKFGDKFGGPTRLSAAADLVRNKANPALGAGANILEGKDKAGNKINPLTEIGQLFVPINIQNAFNSRNNPKDVLKGLPDLVGVGSQTYGVKDTNIPDKQKALLEKITDPKKKEAYTRLFQTAKVAAGTKSNVSDEINKALETRNISKANKLAQEYNDAYDKAFEDWRSKYKEYTDSTLTKAYRSGKINLDSSSVKARLKSIKENQ